MSEHECRVPRSCDCDPWEERIAAVSQQLASRDRKAKSKLVERRRSVASQQQVAAFLGIGAGDVAALEHYSSDPTVSEIRRYEVAVAMFEAQRIEHSVVGRAAATKEKHDTDAGD